TGDPLLWTEVVAVVLVVLGSLLAVYRPGAVTSATERKGILLAVGASLFFSLNACLDRLAVREGTPDPWRPGVSGFGMTLLSALFLLPAVLVRRDRLRSLHAHGSGLWLRGFLEVAVIVVKLYAVQYLSAHPVACLQRL